MLSKFFRKRKAAETLANPAPSVEQTVMSRREEESEVDDKVKPNIQEIPRVCLIDMDSADVSLLKSEGFNCTSGTLGTQIEVPNTVPRHEHICLLSYSFPRNLHEYHILVVNMQSAGRIPYDPADHEPPYVKGKERLALASRYPETLFDPRPFSGTILDGSLSDFRSKESVIVIFANPKEEVEYQLVKITEHGMKESSVDTFSTYSFIESLHLPPSNNLVGKETVVSDGIDSNFRSLLAKHNEDTTYSIIFEHPTEWDSSIRKSVKRANFVPLMLTSDGRIISYADIGDKTSILLFPIIERKGAFLVDLFRDVLPSMFPRLFPYSTQFAWLADSAYQLPNEMALKNERIQTEKEYAKKIQEIERKLQENYNEFSWLHDLLTQTGESLVKTIEHYLHWLGYPKVTNVDEEEPELKGEDIRIELEPGLLVVEVKGIAGTSTDSDCSQISKIRYRRAKERGAFDVYGLYVVNHQRFLPPQARVNPPFSQQQISDAFNDTRGLLTTYDLFNLYYHVQDGFVSKEDARNALLTYGLVAFKPSNALLLGSPLETHYNSMVAILLLNNTEIAKGSGVVVSDGHSYRRAQVIDIQIDGDSVTQASNGEVGIRLDCSVSKTSVIWLQTP